MIEKELPHFMKARAAQQARQLASVGCSVALSLLGMPPGVGIAGGTLLLLKDSPALYFNVRQTLSSRKAVGDLRQYYADKEMVLRRVIAQQPITERSPLYDMVALLSRVVSGRISL